MSRARFFLFQKRGEEKIKKTILALLLIFAFASFPFLFQHTDAQTSPEGTLEFEVPVHGTYLLADSNDYGPEGARPVASPLIVDLAANGLAAGDVVMISSNGTVYPSAYWDGTLGWFIKQDDYTIYALFSSTNQLLAISELNRVPGAIQTALSHKTPETYFSNRPTDIPEDFRIRPNTGMLLEIPNNARYLFFCVGDQYYPDNQGSVDILIEKDADGDGLPNSWEINGIDIDKDGQIDLHLQALGADWQHKDIFVEIDYMVLGGNHTHRPNQDAINDVIRAFDFGDVANPDGDIGVRLHVYVDEQLPHAEAINWQVFDQIKKDHFGTAAERTDPKNVEAKRNAFHYCLFVHSQEGTTSSGSGELAGNDFMVSLGAFTDSVGSREEQAATFMHELGHNLGLNHGGYTYDEINYKPNYVSVMNYLFQMDRYNTGRALDYSAGSHFDLNEASLNESMGINDYQETVWTNPNGTLCRSAGYWEIDWNFDGNITSPVQVNLNNHVNYNYSSPEGENLTDYDDWSNLVFRFRSSVSYGDGEHPYLPVEITAELDAEMQRHAKTVEAPIIIPEFPPWIFLLSLMIITLIGAAFLRRRRQS